MRTEHFFYMLEINRLQSISAAARSLHVGQTRLSAIVKSVEEEVGYPIFQRSPKGVIPTPQGELFIALAWEINVKFEELQRLRDRNVSNMATVNLLLTPSISLRATIPLTRKFQRYDLQSNLVFRESTSAKVVEQILEHAGNVGLCFLTEGQKAHYDRDDDISIEVLRSCELMLFVAKDHPLAQRASVTADDLVDQRMARLRSLDNSFDTVFLPPERKHVTGFAALDILCQAVCEDGYVSILPNFMFASDSLIADDRFRTVRLETDDERAKLDLVLVTSKKRALLHQEKILLQCIREYFSEIPEEENRRGGETA